MKKYIEELDAELSDLVSSKGWNINYKKQAHEHEIVSYYFDPKIGNILPVFNEGFEYTYFDSDAGTFGVLRTIKSTQLPTEIHFGTTHVSQEDASSLLKVLSFNYPPNTNKQIIDTTKNINPYKIYC